MNEFLEISYLVSNEELKFVLLEVLSDQRAKRMCVIFSLFLWRRCTSLITKNVLKIWQWFWDGDHWWKEAASEFLILAI